ncbi:MAG: tetratricopeptide repeat protein [Gemmatimonadota bacterium]
MSRADTARRRRRAGLSRTLRAAVRGAAATTFAAARGVLATAFLLAVVIAAVPPRASAEDAAPASPGAPAAPPSVSADALAEEAVRHWDNREYDEAIAKYLESIRREPRGETYRSLGWLYAEIDRHADAISAFRKAIALDPSLEPELRFELGEQLLWADRPGEAIPLLESVHAARPHDREASRRLALAYRWADRHADSDALYRTLLAEDPSDPEARAGLAWSLLWRDRYREATVEFCRALEKKPGDPDALTGLSRARLFLDLPEEADAFARRALAADPANAEARAQENRIRERVRRRVDGEAWAAHDSDDLTIVRLAASAYARAARGLDLEGSVRRELYRQGSPGKAGNIGDRDRADGTGGFVDADWRPSPSFAFRGGLGLTRYDAGDFHPWSGHAGATFEPRDLLAVSLDWERSHFDSILSFQDRVTADTVGLSVLKSFEGKVEARGTVATLFHHNENDTGQPRENRGWHVTAEVSVPLLRKGDATHLAAVANLEWLSFENDLDVGVFNPRRYTAEEAGVDARWAWSPRWEFFATLLAGAQQERGNAGAPTYSAEAGVDRRVGAGMVTVGAFSTDSSAAGRGGGFRRSGGYLRFRIPF